MIKYSDPTPKEIEEAKHNPPSCALDVKPLHVRVCYQNAKNAPDGDRLSIVCGCGKTRTIVGWTLMTCLCGKMVHLAKHEAGVLRHLHPARIQESARDRAVRDAAAEAHKVGLPLPATGQALAKPKKPKKPIPGQKVLFDAESQS